MLVLKRKEGQAIDVGDDIRIILKEIKGSHVKVVISAPSKVRIRRAEVERQIGAENIRAARCRVEDLAIEVSVADGKARRQNKT